MLQRAKSVGELARVTTLEGHYIRVLGKKDPQERVDGLSKYAQKYAPVLLRDIHPALQAEVVKALKKSTAK